MDKSVCGRQINKKSLILQQPNNSDQSCYKVPQSVPRKKKNKSNIIDYKNISLTMTREISSDDIYRNNLTPNQSNISFIEDPEDNDEEFILNMKRIIDKNYKRQDKENYSVRDLQSKSYLSRKRKCAFSNEDQNLMKQFKKSMNESKTLYVAPQELQQSENNTSDSNHNYLMTTTTPETTPSVALNNIDLNLKNNANQLLFHVTSKIKKNDQFITGNAKTITETEIEELVYYEMQFTPPQKDN